MKKYLIVLSAAAFFAACGGNESANKEEKSGETSTTNTTASASGISEADADKGLELVSKSDCLTCHKVSEKLVGPSYQEVANKYPVNDATIDSLAHKVIHGGAGNWGQVPMTPHPNISQDDARAMVKYVLSLKQ